MSAIIDNAERIRYQRQVSIAQTKSQSGVRQAQRRGPLLYNFFVEIRPLKFGTDAYYAIEDEILDTNYSELTVESSGGGVQITNGNLLTPRGVWDTTYTISNLSQSGDSITLITGSTISAAGHGRKGDFVQFGGYSKVFQLTADTLATGNTSVVLKLNGAIPASTTLVNEFRIGKDVKFKLQLKERPEPEFSETDIVEYSSATFEEVL